MPNTNCLKGMACPECGYRKRFRTAGQVTVLLLEDGTEESRTIIRTGAYSECLACRHMGPTESFGAVRRQLEAHAEKLRDKAAELYAHPLDGDADHAINVPDDAAIDYGKTRDQEEGSEWVQVWVRIPPEEMEHTQ